MMETSILDPNATTMNEEDTTSSIGISSKIPRDTILPGRVTNFSEDFMTNTYDPFGDQHAIAAPTPIKAQTVQRGFNMDAAGETLPEPGQQFVTLTGNWLYFLIYQAGCAAP